MAEQQAQTFVDRVRATIERYGMLSPGDRVVVAVSGGPDSLALLYVLDALRSDLGIELHVAHLNHRMRRAAPEDARFVTATAQRLGLPCTIETVDVRAAHRGSGLSLEQAGRRERYRFFARVAEATGASKVATGHTADDNVETVLINLLRGAGTDGLAGIPPARALPIADCRLPIAGPAPADAAEFSRDAPCQEDRPNRQSAIGNRQSVVRPLVETWRPEVEAYCRALGLEPREDITNRSRAYLRNQVRLDLLPYLQRHFGPQVKPNLQRLSWIARPEVELLESLAGETLQRIARYGAGRTELALPDLLQLPLALRRRVVRAALRRVKGTPEDVGFREIERVLEAAASGEPAPFDLPGPVRVSVEGRCLVLSPPRAKPEPGSAEVLLPLPGQAPAPGGGMITAEVAPKPEAFEVPRLPRAREAALDADAVAPPLTVRSWRPGDRLVPLGMAGHKTLHKLFIEQKVPAAERCRTPVVSDGQGILWVAGVTIADRAKVTDATRRLLCLAWQDNRITG